MRVAHIAILFIAFATVAHAQTPPEGGKPIVIGQSYVMHSTVLNADRRVNVYLPQDYGDPKRTFPVLYLLDGGEDEDFHHITGLVAVDQEPMARTRRWSSWGS